MYRVDGYGEDWTRLAVDEVLAEEAADFRERARARCRSLGGRAPSSAKAVQAIVSSSIVITPGVLVRSFSASAPDAPGRPFRLVPTLRGPAAVGFTPPLA